MEFRFNMTFPRDYASLAARTNNPQHSMLAITGAIKNSIFTAGVYEGDELIAFARVCGDEALCYIICDIMVDERYKGKNMEFSLLKEIDEFLKTKVTKDSRVILIADKEVGKIARSFRFTYFDSDFYAVMKR